MKIKGFKLEEYFAKYEFKAKYLLCSSDCESFSIEELLELNKNAEVDLKKLRLGYTESLGHPELREEISRLYENIEPEEVIVFSGAEEGIFVFMNVLLNQRDNIIVQFPAYQSLFEVANALGSNVTKWTMIERENWELNLEFLRSSISENTKCIVVNFPHNPTGYLPTKKEFKEIRNIAEENKLFVFSDEVYRFMEYDASNRLPAMCDIYKKGISLGVMSKTFGLAGLRIGWIATKDKGLFEKIASFKNYTTICNSAPSEFLSILALKNKERIIKRNLGIIHQNLALLDEFFEKFNNVFNWIKPKAGSIAFPSIKIDRNIEEFCLDVYNKKSVLLMPGTHYDIGKKHFRIGFGRLNMPKSLRVFQEYIVENY